MTAYPAAFRITRQQALRDHARLVEQQRNAAHSTAYIERAAKERAARGAQEPATSNAGSRPSRVLKGS